jgi:mono/diheme cytochrome c family protein
MKKLSSIFLVLSFLLTILALFVVVSEHKSQWRPYQEQFQAYLQKKAVSPTEKETAARFKIKVRQDWVPQLSKTDRCRSCHIAVDQKTALPSEPLTVHPDISPHDFRKFGCTVCHGGDGYATRLPDAHQNLLPQKVIEGSCGKCHAPDLNQPEVPTLAAGVSLVRKYNCRGCHAVKKGQRQLYPGPNLTGISIKVSKEWLKNWLKQPPKYMPKAKMPGFLLNDQQIIDLTGYLSSFSPPEVMVAELASETLLAQQELAEFSDDDYEELAEQGKVVFGRMRCLSCHALNGKGGDIGPDFGKISAKTNSHWMSLWLKDPKAYDPETIMPTFNMTTKERLSVVEYLLAESYENEEDDFEGEDDPQEKVEEATTLEGDIKAGEKLFITAGCYNCHRLAQTAGSTNFAPDLYALADINLEKIEFGNVNIPHTLTDYIVTKLQAPRNFAGNLKMPFFAFDKKDVGRIATALTSMSSTIPASYMRKNAPSETNITGEVGKIFKKYNCLSCHQLNGRGGRLAPELNIEGSQVTRSWLVNYMQKPYPIRPFLIERMPRFNLTASEAQAISDYAKLVWRSDKIDSLAEQKVGDPKKGKELYTSKGCQSCHTIGTDGGYYGPALDSVGGRLKPAWMMARLDNVHNYIDDAREPVMAIPTGDRQHLLAYLMTLVGEEQK